MNLSITHLFFQHLSLVWKFHKTFVSHLVFLSVRFRIRFYGFLLMSWKGLTSWLSFVVSTVSMSLSHLYPGSGVVLDCIDS